MKKYDFAKIEVKWQKFWDKKGVYEPDFKGAKRPFYNLMMFPYPSAEGLHVGNMYAFTGADIYGRFKRMEGCDVFEPIGLDGFGIHSENYALKSGTHPAKQAVISEKRFYKQLASIGNGFASKERLETYDPEYYKWTQWIFVQMFKNGLAYRKKQAVNWCPSDKTVLADEQVVGGKCERCGALVIQKELEQWFFRITKYADRLLKNLEKLDWSERIKIAQRNWIGKSEGAEVDFEIKAGNIKEIITVFTTRPDTLFGATYLVLSPEHKALHAFIGESGNSLEIKKYIEEVKNKSEEERMDEKKEKTGVELKGIKAVNPVNGEEIPVWISDYVLASYGTGAIMAVPAHDQRDFEFAKKFNLDIKAVIMRKDTEVSILSSGVNKTYKVVETKNDPRHKEIIAGISESLAKYPTVGEGVLINSGKFNGMDSDVAKWEITKFVSGKREIKFRLRDWLISRQRYWGPPIPMIFCENCSKAGRGEREDMPGWYSVSEKDLPVKLPFVKDFRPAGEGVSPLASEKSFYEVRCPSCKEKARRETDVSDTFLDSAWYYLRYPSVSSATRKSAPWDKEITKKWLPVNMYTGGAEHAVLHLLYVRFVAMVLKDAGFIDFEEPATKFRAHGLLIKDGAKMSKSKGNVINPDEYVKRFGADTLRMYLMFLAPFEQGGDFRDEGIMGTTRFLERFWKFIQSEDSENKENLPILHRTIKKVTEDIENLHYNTAISALMILLNKLESGAGRKDKEIFLKLLAPFAPHITEELWDILKFDRGSIHRSAWPKYDSNLCIEETAKIAVQINGKLRATLELPSGAREEEVISAALNEPKIKEALGGQRPKRTIYVAGRLINLVI